MTDGPGFGAVFRWEAIFGSHGALAPTDEIKTSGTPVAEVWGTSVLYVPRPNHSELWQRLRAARELAHKSHQDVGKVMGLSDMEVALWESPDPSTRMQPTAQQVMRVAKLCRLPLYLLLDDAVSMEDIQSFTGP